MRRPHIRDFHADDLEGVVRLWEDSHRDEERPVYSLAEVIASCQADHAVVAVLGERIIGVGVGRAAHAQGWVVFFATSSPAFDEVVGPDVLDALERRMAHLGLGKLSMLIPEGSDRLARLVANGFEVRSPLRYLERAMPVDRRQLDVLRAVGGRILPRDLWGEVAGMHAEKALLEERLVTPLARPDLADRFGVVPPRAAMLFGPPGTGKTTFAQAVASRLNWPFVEVFPSRLSDAPAGLPTALRATFDAITALEHVVVFIDEVEEVASRRHGDPPSPNQAVTNELLKILADFRYAHGRLLICATNFIRSLDDAFLRHGRFDFVLPIGLPDAAAHAAIWRRYVPAAAPPSVDIDALVEASTGLTPADIEYAARRASQDALSDALRLGDAGVDRAVGTFDYLRALEATRATVSADAAREFLDDIDRFARL